MVKPEEMTTLSQVIEKLRMKRRDNEFLLTPQGFSVGSGKFYQPGTVVELPVYLDNEVLSYLSKRATSKKIALNDLVNDLLRKEIASLQAE